MGALAAAALPPRSSRIGALIFWWACVMYRSNSSLLAWRRIAFWSASGSLENMETSLGVLVMRAIPRGVGLLLGYGKPTLGAVADTIRTWVCVSLFDRLPAGGSDLETNDLDRLGSSLHDFAFGSSKPGSHEAADNVAIEPMGAHKQCFGRAVRVAGEQL